MNRNQAQKRINDGFRVFAYSPKHERRFELRWIGLAACYSTCGQELNNRRVEFGI
jgi:hypothetical protein